MTEAQTRKSSLTGSRIRERRVMRGMKQAELAQRAGISASYLNLIEHNRRRIGGKLLLAIAAELGVEPQALTEGAEAALLATLREAASDAGLSEAEAARADEFAGRFPGWAATLAASQRRATDLEHLVEQLGDKMTHDPHLASAMHELLTTAAAVRSTAAILAETKALEPEWRERFHHNIDEDSARLAETAQALVRYLEGGSDDTAAKAQVSPQDEVEAFLTRHGFSFAALEGGAGEAAIETLLTDAPELQSQAAQHIAHGVLRQTAQDAAALPLEALRKAVTDTTIAPVALARDLGVGLACVLRRLAALPELGAGLIVCDRSGTVIYRKSVDGFSVPRLGSGCPLWPLFAVLGQPGMAVRERLGQLGRGRVEFDAYAAAEAQGMARYNRAPLTQAVMLLIPAAPGGPDGALNEVGATCRICSRAPCAARREPSILQRA